MTYEYRSHVLRQVPSRTSGHTILDTLIESFALLFGGNRDTYGTEHGGAIHKSLTRHVWQQHLQGGEPIGVYPMVEQADRWEVAWSCIDLDVQREGKRRYDYQTEDDANLAVHNLATVYQTFNIRTWVEVTRSHGRHLWAFYSHPVNATTARRAGLAACKIAGVPPTEVNPKQTDLAAGQIGNYVRIPYPAVARDVGLYLNRYMLGYQTSPDRFVETALAERVDPELLDPLAELHTAPFPGAPTDIPITVGGVQQSAIRKMSGLTYTVFTCGPSQTDGDRSVWLYRLAALCAADRIDQTDACAIVYDADSRYTHKYVGQRPDAINIIVRTVVKAYQQAEG